MITYTKILSSLAGSGIFKRYEYNFENPIPYIKNKKYGIYERIQFLISFFHYYNVFFLISKLSKIDIHTIFHKKKKNENKIGLVTTQKVFTGLLEYFIKTHIRKHLRVLYDLYSWELISQSGKNTSGEIDELRKILTDIKNHLNILPNPRKIIITLGSIAFGIISTIEFLGFRSMLFELIEPMLGVITIILFLPFLFGTFIVRPFVSAFKTKRMLFLDTKNDYHYSDHYFGSEKKLYEQSVYKLETDLYEKLDAKSRKPKEDPIDCILLWIAGGIPIVFFASLFLFFAFDVDPENDSELQPIHLSVLFLEIAIIGFVIFIDPLIRYRRRLKNHLI